MRAFAALLFLPLALGACAGAPPPANAPVTPTAPPPEAPAPAPVDPLRTTVPPPPESCRAELAVDGAPGPSCADAGAARLGLAGALKLTGRARDEKLAELESCSVLPVGAIRALRADLAATGCADLLTGPWLSAPPSGLRADVRDTLEGLDLAAKASRLVQGPPALAEPHDKARVEQFVKTTLSEWIAQQAAAIFELSTRGANLDGYGKGVIAVEAGLADLRFVDIAREVPVPVEFRTDPELAEAYYTTLDQALEPRKERGRVAALVGLAKLAEQGVVKDARVGRARVLLSRLYAGRRIDALDGLLLPEAPRPSTTGVDAELARLLPTYHLGVLAPELATGADDMLALALENGVPRASRLTIDSGQRSDVARRALARALFRLAQTYWSASDFAQAAALAAGLRLADMELIAALAPILAKGPANAAQMMQSVSELSPALRDVRALDALGAKSPSLAGFVDFDAALLLEIGRPADSDAAYWKGVAARYEAAQRRLPPELRKLATARHKNALDVAGAIPR